MRRSVLLGLMAAVGCGQPTEERRSPIAVESEAKSASVAPQGVPSATNLSPSPATAQNYQALGTEPFWSLEVLPGKLIYTSPETQSGVVIAARLSNAGKQLRYSGEMDGKNVMLTIERGECSDGMSDTVYSHKASFTWGDRTEQGCARLK